MNFKNKKILVTGSDGFIGSHLIERLLEEDCKVRAFVYYNSFNSWGWLDTFPKEMIERLEIVSGDIRDYNFVEASMKNIDLVFHLAALISIPFSYNSPESFVDTNVKGTLNVLQAAKKNNVSRVLSTSTSEIYGTAIYVPIDEKHPKQSQSPYSASKIGADFMSESFYRSFNLPVTIVRPFNTYGPRQSLRAVIPTIIMQLLNCSKEIKLGSLHPSRDLTFVRDVVNGFVEIAKSEKTIGEEVNISTNTEISIGELSNKIIKLINSDAKVVYDKVRVRPKNSEVERLLGSNKKVLESTSWKQKYSLDEGLKITIEWFKNSDNLIKYKSNFYNV